MCIRSCTGSVQATAVTEPSQVPWPFASTSVTIYQMNSPYSSTILTHKFKIHRQTKWNERISKKQFYSLVLLIITLWMCIVKWIYSSTILKLSTRWTWLINFKPLPFYPPRGNTGGWIGPGAGMSVKEKRKSILPLPGVELFRSLVATRTEWTMLLNVSKICTSAIKVNGRVNNKNAMRQNKTKSTRIWKLGVKEN
jgi:hypothetical protein